MEEKLASWTGPSSSTEQDKQDRTERMIREAVKGHAAFDSCDLRIYPKGSYANNTNVKTDSDVDIAVQCRDVTYWDEASPGIHIPSPYRGIWTPAKLRSELERALLAKFPGQVDTSGSVAFRIHSGSARVDADVVPCFNYRRYFANGNHRDGAKVFRKDGTSLINYPDQQLKNGRDKNNRTSQYYKKAVRIMKRVENAMVLDGKHKEIPSFFVECLVYHCPDDIFLRSTWTKTVRGVISHIFHGLEGSEPEDDSQRWREVNECKYLFHANQPWSRADGRAFAKAAWNYLGLTS
ncbi:nucleotidyltransferase [Micromonospora sp. NPDC006766]|uniref:nucleotidyltransferase domain-containing protein n=1 Tax=Micromonospora sp. NPDC006766 TaxID=3154778 RepID=UPI00340460B0